MAGGTTFYFLDALSAEALEVAREAAGGLDVRIGGGATVVREFLAAGLVDHMHRCMCRSCWGAGSGCGMARRRLSGITSSTRSRPRAAHPPDLHEDGRRLSEVRVDFTGTSTLGLVHRIGA